MQRKFYTIVALAATLTLAANSTTWAQRGTLNKNSSEAQRPDEAQVNPGSTKALPGTAKNPGGPATPVNQREKDGAKPTVATPGTVSKDAQKAAEEAHIPKKDANKARDVVENVGPGKVNWTKQIVEVTGSSAIDSGRFKNKAQARLMATQGAKADAYRNLLATLKGVEVTSETTVEDMITTSDYVQTRIQGVVKGATQVGAARVIDGAVVVRMQVTLYGQDGLAGAIYDALDQVPNTPGQKEPSSTDLPSAQEGVTDAGKDITPEVAAALRGSAPKEGEKQIAFNLQNKNGLNPQLFPVFVNEQGETVLNTKVLYDPEKGEFPKWLQMGREVLNRAGVQKGVEIIDVVQNPKGEFVIPKVEGKWGQVLDWATRIGKTLLMFTPLAPMVK